MIYLESISVSIPHISSVISVHSVISLPASASSTSSSEASATSETIPYSVSTKTTSPIIHSVHSSGGRSYSNVNEVSDDKLAIVKCLVVIWSPLRCNCCSNISGLTSWILSEVRIHQSKVKVGSSSSGLWIDLLDQSLQLLQGSVHPGVDLELICRGISCME